MSEGVIYYTKIRKEDEQNHLVHMIGEKLLAEGLRREYGLDLKTEPRAEGEHGKPFFTLRPSIHYNISHSGEYILCIFADQEVGIDVQEHKKANYERMLDRMVPGDLKEEILGSADMVKDFYTQWVLREAYIKLTGEGLSRDLRTIPMEEGCFMLLELEDGYSGAVWAMSPMELRMEHVQIRPESLYERS